MCAGLGRQTIHPTRERSVTGTGEQPKQRSDRETQEKRASPVARLVKNPPTMWETSVQSPGWEGLLEKGKATYPLQYSGLENSMDYTVHGVAKSRTQTE